MTTKAERRRFNFGKTRTLPWSQRGVALVRLAMKGVRMPKDHPPPKAHTDKDGNVDPNWEPRSYEGLPWCGSKRVPLRKRKRALASFDRQMEHRLRRLVEARS